MGHAPRPLWSVRCFRAPEWPRKGCGVSAARASRHKGAFILQVLCAWYGASLGEKPGGDGVSHGVCPACLEKLLAHLEASRLVTTVPNSIMAN